MSILTTGYRPVKGDKVLVQTSGSRVQGIIQYIGKVGKSRSVRYGIELSKPMGTHNGTYKGKKYFKCEKNHGVMVKRSSIIKKIKMSRTSSLSLVNISKLKQKPVRIPNDTFERLQTIIFHLIRTTLLSNTILIDPHVISLIYIYCNPYQFKFVTECVTNSGYISWSTVKKTVIRNINNTGGFGIVLLGYNGLFPFPEWNLVHIPIGNTMEYQCSLHIHDQQNKKEGYVNSTGNGYFGIAVLSQKFYHFSSLKGIEKQKKSQIYCMIHDSRFGEENILLPTKYYGEYKPKTIKFNFAVNRITTFKIQCKKYIAKGTKGKVQWKSRIIVECDKRSFTKKIGSTAKIKKFRIGLVLYAPDPDIYIYKCKAHVENQEVNQLCNVDW
eukprot:200587_1